MVHYFPIRRNEEEVHVRIELDILTSARTFPISEFSVGCGDDVRLRSDFDGFTGCISLTFYYTRTKYYKGKFDTFSHCFFVRQYEMIDFTGFFIFE